MPDIGARPHAWAVDPREYARHETRRGRRHAYEELTPERTALVVVDMVPFFVQDSPYCLGIVPPINLLADALRAAGGVVAWVLPANGAPLADRADEFYGPAAAVYRTSGGSGPPRSRLWPGLDVHTADLITEKTAFSAFFPGRSQLPALLAERAVDTVLITGTVTNVCCESTARDAATLGLRVIMLADANAARTDEEHNASLRTVYRSFGDVRTTPEVIALLGAPRP